VLFFGTIAASLAMLNIFYLFFLIIEGESKKALIAGQDVVQTGGIFSLSTSTYYSYQIALWTLGATLHSLYNIGIWKFAACGVCYYGGTWEHLSNWRWLGTLTAYLLVFLTAAGSTWLVLARPGIEKNPEGSIERVGEHVGDGSNIEVGETADYKYLMAWIIEFVLALFVYEIIFNTLLFSGFFACLTCGRDFPILTGTVGLGGRPYEVRQERKKRKTLQKSRRLSTKAIGKDRKRSSLLAASDLQPHEMRKSRKISIIL
jgi:hypothetical protein